MSNNWTFDVSKQHFYDSKQCFNKSEQHFDDSEKHFDNGEQCFEGSELGLKHSVHCHLLLKLTLFFVEDGELRFVELSEQCILLNLT